MQKWYIQIQFQIISNKNLITKINAKNEQQIQKI